MTPRRLLVADDEEDFGSYVRKVAEKLGYNVKVTTNGRDFMDAFDDFAPSHVILDVIMPKMDGIEVVKWIAERGSPVKLVIVTGYNPHYLRLAGILAGAKGLNVVGTYTKPFRLTELRAALS